MSCHAMHSDACHTTEICGVIQTSSEGTPILTTTTVIYGGSLVSVNPSVSAIGLFGNSTAVAVITVSFLTGGSSGSEVARFVVGSLETHAFTVIGFDTIVASATFPAALTYTIEIKTRA